MTRIVAPYIHHEIADNLVVTNDLGMCLLGLEEIVQKVAARLLVVGRDALHDALVAVHGRTLKGREFDGAPGILAQPSINPWRLTDLERWVSCDVRK